MIYSCQNDSHAVGIRVSNMDFLFECFDASPCENAQTSSSRVIFSAASISLEIKIDRSFQLLSVHIALLMRSILITTAYGKEQKHF